MKQPIEMRNLYEHETDAYNLKDFKPQIVDAEYLKQECIFAIHRRFEEWQNR